MKRTPLKRGRRRRVAKGDRERWMEAWLPWCVICGRNAEDLHHVVYSQHVRSHGGDEWHPDNALPVCRLCHDAHHGRARPIPVGALLQQNREFARELLGEAAGDYFDRYYSADMERAA